MTRCELDAGLLFPLPPNYCVDLGLECAHDMTVSEHAEWCPVNCQGGCDDCFGQLGCTCPTSPDDDACTDMTPCTRCPSAVGLLTADEVAAGVAGQESAWAVGQYEAAPPSVGSTQRGLTTHPHYRKGGCQ